jgi:hypothetical protein
MRPDVKLDLKKTESGWVFVRCTDEGDQILRSEFSYSDPDEAEAAFRSRTRFAVELSFIPEDGSFSIADSG